MATLARWGEWFFRKAANNDRTTGTKLVLSGPPGCGKTHVATRVSDQLGAWAVDMALGKWPKFPFKKFVDWSEVSESEKGVEFDDILVDIKEASIVILDDVGSECDRYNAGISASRLRRALAACDHKWLLITTNLSQEQFHQAYDARVADRLAGAHWRDLSNVPSYRMRG